jgi:DNA (cytosine-5)-methyltransferase 1
MGHHRTFIELFAGGGLARAGLGAGWSCLLANDIDGMKASAYRANWGDTDLVVGDVRGLSTDRVSERPDLVWASPPCSDVSIAGPRGGLDGGRSGAVWPALDFIRRLGERGLGPRLIVVENVTGLASSRGGGDLAAVVRVLSAAKYKVGALVVDAAVFVPQSRRRLFVIAAAEDVAIPRGLVSEHPSRPWHPASLTPIAGKCERWMWLVSPAASSRRQELADLLDDDAEVRWHTASETEALLALMAGRDSDRVGVARKTGTVVGTLTRRMRPAMTGSQQRADLRTDGVAGCLRTPGGGSSQQSLLVADRSGVRTRPLTPREAARLMGLPDSYKLPRRREDALRLLGDGVAVPVVRHLAANLLEPMLALVPEAAAVSAPRPGIKGATRSTTLYLLPPELQRLRRLAVDLDVSLHDLMLRGLDRVLAEHGQRPIERYC